MFDVKPSKLAGCLELQPKVFDDARGRFVKVFHEQAFAAQGLETGFAEEYYSVSHKNVIRGLHFQLPPMDHVKMVYCVAGEVMDAVVDLRAGSPTYGQFDLFELSAAKANSIYIPKGMAHGFCARSDQAIMVYKVGTIYSPAHDAGVLWNSVGIPWPTTEAILSARDQSFPSFDKFASPFRYE
ncbi:dTDP-4-dehydrorhamnose 3,5-epimerase [Sideroxyarcus emersonii]|uniref:dTDP-4-dehydrorhamnose 3,5-epimerase n=1 Tax=Sideroxyarcus emersonii TaxID=2764705 RepID=A0AAN1XCM2_9PROT|nr:dTDP-4-dehydrorhamnose 3,5-epimerase [Sideroxyarcus emersonii]BCK88819.1 dTDP-4-dehydrorhamnose 3,5-epimerase [Sideroxyarcus emersonii]